MRQFTSLLMACALILGAPVGPASGGTQSVVPIEGTRFVATDTTEVRVRFERPIEITDRLRRAFPIDVRGRGRVYGYLLRKVGDYEQDAYRPLIQNVVIGQCSRERCKGRRPFMFTVFWNVGDHLNGMWDLYVVADGGPVEISFGRRANGPFVRPAT